MDYENIIKKLDILPVKELIHQEERIEKNLIRLKEAMLNIGQLVDPIIIDKKHKIVLDGNHRVKVLGLIKVPYAVCQIVDYNDPKIEVGSWYPADKKITKKMMEDAGTKLEAVDFELGEKEVQNGKAAFMFANEKESYLINPNNYSLDEMIEEQQKILKKTGDNFWYVPDVRTKKEMSRGKGILLRKIYSKEEIIKRALSGVPFPPKSNRHLIPNRIIRLNMRLGWLHQDKEESMRYLERLLKNRVYAGSVRRYLEPVIVIY